MEQKPNPEHEKLIEILKFTPRTYTISLYGYGGETVVGRIDQKVWDYFRDNRVNVSDFAWDSEYGEDVPEDLRPFEPSCWYDCDNIMHTNGVSLNAGTLEILDENDKVVYTRDLSTLDGVDIAIETDDECSTDHLVKTGPIFYAHSSEKGLFFEGKIELTSPFDPNKLTLIKDEIDSESLVNSVRYDGEYIDNYDMSTNGKGFECRFYNLVDDEFTSYESGDDVDENFDDGTPPSGPSPDDWEKSPKITEGNPTISGWYSCNYGYSGNTWGSLYWNNDRGLWESYYHGRVTEEYKQVVYYQGYNWDTSDWANRPSAPVEVKCKHKGCGWTGKREDMRTDDDYNDHCPECDGTNWEWIDYDPETKEGKKNRVKYGVK